MLPDRRWTNVHWNQLTLAEISGSLGDLGTLIPLLLPLAKQGSVHFVPALFFAGLFNVVGGFVWDVPMCVQPMKTIAAVALTEGLSAVQVSTAGLLVAIMVLLLGVTRGIVLVNDLIPTPVVRGLQLGLGLSLMRKGVALIEQAGSWAATADCYLTAICCFAVSLALHRRPTVPVALLIVLIGLIIALASDTPASALPGGALSSGAQDAAATAWPVTWGLRGVSSTDVSHALIAAALPQLPLTTLNSIVSTCKLSQDLFPDRPRPTQTSLAWSVGLMNLCGCLLGAMPMCHGAGGLAAQYRFGARHGCSMVFLGAVKMGLSLVVGAPLLLVLDRYPSSVLGVLLLFSGLELSRCGAPPPPAASKPSPADAHSNFPDSSPHTPPDALPHAPPDAQGRWARVGRVWAFERAGLDGGAADGRRDACTQDGRWLPHRPGRVAPL